MPFLSLSRRRTTEPTYLPDGFDIPDNYNVLKVSEIHAFEESDWSREKYLESVSEQINDYIESYNADEVWILGDTGSFEDVETLLESMENDAKVTLVAGDEDKTRRDDYTGWFADRRTSSEEPFDVDVDYQIFDEGFETRIDGMKIQAAHHPNNKHRDDEIRSPDQRSSEILEDLFCLKRYDNENTLEQIPPPRMEDVDVAVYDHVHMPYVRTLGDTIAEGLGGRRYNYQRSNEALPERSIHLTSFGDEVLSTLHFDAENDDIFEHLAFDRRNDFKMYDVQASRYENQQSGYQLIQTRFNNDQIVPESHEAADQMPPFWE